MQILPIYSQNNNNQNFQAVSQKYLKRAEREFKNRKGITGDLLECLRADVYFRQISPQDGIDTIEAIKKLTQKTDLFTEHVLDGFRIFKNELQQ